MAKKWPKKGKKRVKITYFGENGSNFGPQKWPVFGPLIKCIIPLINAGTHFLSNNFQDLKKVKKHEKVEKSRKITKNSWKKRVFWDFQDRFDLFDHQFFRSRKIVLKLRRMVVFVQIQPCLSASKNFLFTTLKVCKRYSRPSSSR